MKNKKSSLVDIVDSFVFSGLIIGAFLGIVTMKSISYNKKAEAAHNASMAIYEPVGNGGALYAMSGKTTPERRQMYRDMHAEFYRIMWEEK